MKVEVEPNIWRKEKGQKIIIIIIIIVKFNNTFLLINI